MRLIDADDLKNDLITFFPDKCLEGITTKTLFKQILTDIDNAPTVEPFEKVAVANVTFDKEQLEEIVEKAKAEVLAEVLVANGRPIGEWVEFADFVARNVVNEDFDEEIGFYAEVLCRKLVKLGLVKLDADTYKYCGANIRKGGAES